MQKPTGKAVLCQGDMSTVSREPKSALRLRYGIGLRNPCDAIEAIGAELDGNFVRREPLKINHSHLRFRDGEFQAVAVSIPRPKKRRLSEEGMPQPPAAGMRTKAFETKFAVCSFSALRTPSIGTPPAIPANFSIHGNCLKLARVEHLSAEDREVSREKTLTATPEHLRNQPVRLA
jgi:hypothetical protein